MRLLVTASLLLALGACSDKSRPEIDLTIDADSTVDTGKIGSLKVALEGDLSKTDAPFATKARSGAWQERVLILPSVHVGNVTIKVYAYASADGSGDVFASGVSDSIALESSGAIATHVQLKLGTDVMPGDMSGLSDGGVDGSMDGFTSPDLSSLKTLMVSFAPSSLGEIGTATVSSDGATPAINDCTTDCSGTFASGTVVTLTATGTGDSAGRIVRWTGCDTFTTDSPPKCRVTMNGFHSVLFSIDTHNYMFVTSGTISVTGIGANVGGASSPLCTSAAMTAGLPNPGSYAAWLSTSAQGAKDRFTGFQGWIRPDGLPFTSDLSSGNQIVVLYPPKLDENGQVLKAGATRIGNPHPEFLATGTKDDGTASSNTCGDWSQSTSHSFSYGFTTAGTSNWTSFSGGTKTASCTGVSAHIYCFEKTLNTALPVVTPPTGAKLAFLSSTLYSPGTASQMSYSDANALCNSDRNAGNAALQSPSRMFKAYLNTGSGAWSNFTGPGPWYRRDGVKLVTDLTSATFDAPLDLFADGTSSIGSDGANGSEDTWTGQFSSTSQTCSNWTSGSGVGTLGSSFLSEDDAIAITNGQGNCSQGYHIYCLEGP